MHISAETVSAKFHAFESSIKSTIKNLFASLHSISDIKMTNNKPADFRAIAFSLDDDVGSGSGKTILQGYTNNFRGKGEDAIILHGSTDGRLTVGTKACKVIENGHEVAKLDTSETRHIRADELVSYLKKKSDNQINLADNTGPIHLLSCYGKRYAAQELANATGRDVIAYSHQQIRCGGLQQIERINFSVESAYKNKYDPRKIIYGTEAYPSVPKTFHPVK
ncbi:hypothetical protein [Morganella psychrotolerans]|uniref:Uncharacterized protein n=1 Tax=Morganella psychrotolerans TaxID=368603 RepID=A0A1B8HK81_9GAMM|nr:hypothetical protein [Morganella psychrotolerans]OBU09608.1 hypothetical protein AYY18_19510 [Morganella psychrotolerans]